MNMATRRRTVALFASATALAVAGMAMVGVWLRPTSGNQVVINGTVVPPVPTLNAERVAQGEALYAQYCASCHGPNLEGQPNWKQSLPDGSLPAPPHNASGHTWHHPDEKLLDITLRGGQVVYGDANYKSNMPAFGDKLSEADITALLDFIKSRWGKDQREYQWWMTTTGADQ